MEKTNKQATKNSNLGHNIDDLINLKSFIYG